MTDIKHMLCNISLIISNKRPKKQVIVIIAKKDLSNPFKIGHSG